MKLDIEQLEFIDGKLRRILVELEQETGFEFTVTSLYRIDDTGVHGTLPLRGVDLRVRNEELGASLVALINKKWKYNKTTEKQCGLVHGSGYNFHLHVQVHPETALRSS